MTFHADLHGLDRLAGALENAAADVGQITWRIRNKADVGLGGEGLINALRFGVQHSYQWGQEHSDHISRLLTASATGVRFARKQYAETDDRSARDFDLLFRDPSPDRRAALDAAAPPRTGGVLFGNAGAVDPEWFLDRGHHAENPPDFTVTYNYLVDTLSPSANVRIIVYKLFGKDIFEAFLKDLSGDWNGLWNAGTEFGNCAPAMEAVGRNVCAIADDLPAVWRGEAADACHVYLRNLGLAIQGQAQLYRMVGEKYRTAAEYSWSQFDLMGVALGKILDQLVVLAVAVAAGTATIETGLGAIIGYGASLYLVLSIFQLWEEFTGFYDKVDIALKVADTAMRSLGGTNGGLCPRPLPPEPYMFQHHKAGPQPPDFPREQP
ncbi:hypothetical protein ACNTMW_29145 [Planosporangium sp. 12N6]|uniref:hypothetical protein n=1 Tax=Planosporangium spinosum TaxID=3402278 RepID=UPI003CE940AF